MTETLPVTDDQLREIAEMEGRPVSREEIIEAARKYLEEGGEN